MARLVNVRCECFNTDNKLLNQKFQNFMTAHFYLKSVLEIMTFFKINYLSNKTWWIRLSDLSVFW